MTDDVGSRLWNAGVTPAAYDAASEKYQNAILEQYKIYVEMADRISARRALTNTFFLTLNTSVFSVIGIFWSVKPVVTSWWLLVPLLALLAECAAWFYLVRSYRQLNTAKYQVVGALEERLPASPYWRAEWVALGEGRDRSRYWPLTHLEQWIPITFAAIYLLGAVVAVFA
ncbi:MULTISPECIES: RipA family octameric membrane protein [Actinokineospora]|uniref:Membrane protein n=1 Tax=Actinokineospora fastidiosa TaxID=1816 RepID=A0A918GL47_9PSEU|nr:MULTISPECIES: hypothetical protein [Actinokineospora]UVS78550.1 hypothetical protein Actkin_02283 [Actinokineospora sp. UTMC 2448]GGS45252.1 membrane protein [Actinokineospora fastidiosa]